LEQHLGCSVVGEANTLANAVKLARSLRPDVALVDIELVMGQPPARLRRIAEAFPDLRVVVMLNGESRHYRLAVADRWGYTSIVKEQADYELAGVIAGIRPVAA
jgi:DNA-binding NarL/FixJ family response regulator